MALRKYTNTGRIARNRRSHLRMKGRNREIIAKAKDKPCHDCWRKYPKCCMEFDHARGKLLFNIGGGGRTGNMSVKKLVTEIAKCDVVCANCHKIRTFKRAGWNL